MTQILLWHFLVLAVFLDRKFCRKQIKWSQTRNQPMLVRVYIWKQRKKICIPTRGRRSCDQHTYFGRKVIRFSILKYGGHCKHSRSRGMSYLENRNSVAFPDNSKNAVAVKSSCISGSSCSKKTIPNMLVSCMLYQMPRRANCRIFPANW